MLRVDVNHTRAGMCLALPVQNPQAPSRMLLRVGYVLTDEVIAKLREMRVRCVWVQYPSLAVLEQFVSPETVQKQAALVDQVAGAFTVMQGESAAKLRYDEYNAAVGGLIDHMIGNPSSAIFLGDIAADSDGLMRHSSSVTYLAVLMGLKLEGYLIRERRHTDPARAKEISNLGLGAMLHDVGVMQLPEDVRERYELTGDESELEYREHTTLGYYAVRGGVDPTAANVVLHHHQRHDGSGWTGEGFNVLEGKRIHIFSRIVALADTFDALRRPMGEAARPQVQVLRELLQEPLADKFDPQVIGALLAVAPPYPPGTTVCLNDGRFAVTIDHHAEHPCRPTVQFIPDPSELCIGDDDPGETLNLVDAPDEVFVAEAEGCDVSGFNFELPPRFAEHYASGAW